MNSLYDIEQLYFSNLQSIFYKMLNNKLIAFFKNNNENYVFTYREMFVFSLNQMVFHR